MEQRRQSAAQDALHDIVWLINGTMQNRAIESYKNAEEELEGKELLALLQRNFSKLDPNNDGISRQELTAALMKPAEFSVNEYAMLKLIAKYFDTIINLSDDEAAEETRITRHDCDALSSHLSSSNLKLSELHRWIAIQNGTATENEIGPPPLFGGSSS